MPKRPPIFKRPRAGKAFVKSEAERPSAAKRGYDRRWRSFREYFLNIIALPDTATRPSWAKGKKLVCWECGAVVEQRLLEIDHIIPLSAGGAKYDPTNMFLRCKPCHTAKTFSENRNGC